MFKNTLMMVAALAAFAAPASWAQSTGGPKEAISAAVQQALTPMLGNDSGAVVKRLLEIKPEPGMGRNFNLSKVYGTVFGRNGAVAGADCRVATTPAGEADAAPCVYEQGKREDPNGAYAMLSFSKNLGQGNVKFIKRSAFTPGGATEPPAAKLSDADAHKAALQFAELLGIPRSDIPSAPAGAKNTLPVRSLAIGAGQERTGGTRTVIQKVVSLRRAFAVPGGLYRDPTSGILLQHVLAPGVATIAVDDGGVQFARVEGWADAPMDPKLNPALAKSLKQLTDEITDDLYNEGVRKVGSLSILISLRQAYPNPDDPNPVFCPVCGVLRPALRVAVSQAGPERVQTSAQNIIAPGLVREYDLVDSTEAERPAR